MAVENVDMDVGCFEPLADRGRKRGERNRVLLHREIGIDAEPAPRPPPAALVIVAHLFGQAEPVVLVEENPERAVVGPLERIENRAVHDDVLQGVLAGLIRQRRHARRIENDALLFVIGHGVDGLDQRLYHLGLGLRPVDGRKRGKPASSEVILQTDHGGLAEKRGDGGHESPFFGRGGGRNRENATRCCSIYTEQIATSTCAAQFCSAYRTNVLQPRKPRMIR